MDLYNDFISEVFAGDEQAIVRFEEVRKTLGIELKGFLAGTINQPHANYDETVQTQILEDTNALLAKQKCTAKDNPRYIATAGAPGVGKSHWFEAEFINKPGFDGVYADPDRVALPALTDYVAMKDSDPARAYEVHRDASNFMANFLIVWGAAHGYDIYHGTTSQSPRNKATYTGYKSLGYAKEVHVIFATPEQRAAALNHRAAGGIVQVTAEDAAGKAIPVIERLNDMMLPKVFDDEQRRDNAQKVRLYVQDGEYWNGTGTTNYIGEFLDKRVKKEGETYNTFSASMHINGDLTGRAQLEKVIRSDAKGEHETLADDLTQKIARMTYWLTTYGPMQEEDVATHKAEQAAHVEKRIKPRLTA